MRNKRLLIIFGILLSLTLLVAIGSAIFSIRRVDAYCYNADDDALISEVLEGKGKLMGKSVFALDENALISDIESRVGGIKIVNIERLFPNRVSINFVKLYDYFEVTYNGSYFISAIDGKILRKQEESGGDKVIKIKLNLNEEPQVGGTFASAENFEVLQDMINMLERLNFRESDATSIISRIDLTFSEYNIYIGTRGGVLIKLIGFDNAGEKLRKALSLYSANEECRTEGMIIAINKDDVYYSKDKDKLYEESNL